MTTTCGTAGSGYGRMVLATAGVRAYYRLDEQAGTAACDLVAGQTGSYGGGYALRRAGALADDPDTSVGFSGGGWTRVPSTPALSPAQALSLEAWIRPYSLTSSQTILRKDGQYLLRIADGRVILRTWSSAGMVELSSPQALRAGAFQHVAGTFDGSALRIYLNGRQIAARSASGRVQATSNALYLGASGGSYDFLGGDVDEVALYGSALSAATVAGHYDAGAPSTTSPTPTPTPTPSSTPTPVATPTPTPTSTPGDDPGLGDGKLFRSDAWVNAPIPAGAVRDPRSDSIMASFRSFVAAGGAAVTWTRYGQPLYLLSDAEARGAAVRRYSVKQTRYPSPKAYLRNVPIPDSAAPDPGDDGYMTIIDDRPASPTYGCMYDIFEGVRQSDGSWWASSANRNWTDDGNYTPGEGSGPRGSSFAPAAGVLRPEEIGSGRINHALVFAYGRNGPTPVKPSYHSDGGYTGSDALPEGALLRLRPDTDLSALPPGWQVIGRALKEFGAYDVDNGGSNPAFALSALNTTVSSLAWGYGLGWPWGTTTYPTIPSTIWQNLELMPMTPQTEVQESPPVSHPCGDYSDTP